ncbi:transmembrane protein 144-like [Ylistrum balloti]|uniref:transmembrane protein 144-like n=1 Tax=Ylistrum balloti TaxID=509963 RepID=UPI002905F320|nr:transmembrane protein 144-like [Ylistrum balloti]
MMEGWIGNTDIEIQNTTTISPTTLSPNMTTLSSLVTTISPNITTLFPNVTTIPPDCDTSPAFVGYIAAAVAVLCYGTNFAPVKKFETGDGMFFQWIVCSAILLSGMVLQIVRQSTFYPIVMVGGVLWETGNIMVVPIIKTIGLGLGLCIWGMVNLLSGWATGRFGLFGIDKEVPDDPTMNYVGVAVAVSSAVVFSFVKSTVKAPTDGDQADQEQEADALISSTFGNPNDSLYSTASGQEDLLFNRPAKSINGFGNESRDGTFLDRLSPNMKRFVGILLSVISGLLYGQIFTPSLYVQSDSQTYPSASKNGLDYVFACFCGIYLSSTVYFCIYALIRKNQPRVYPRVIVPGIISGIMWAAATASWFLANRILSEPVAFPIITTLPSVVASILGIFVFKEIRGKRNILILLLGFCMAGSGAVLAGLSKHGNKCHP